MEYIDYDTREITFSEDVPKAYQVILFSINITISKVMSVLMNYKRTVEDFKRCGSKAPTVYGIGFISDCVGTSKFVGTQTYFIYDQYCFTFYRSLTCNELKYPVPCGDGKCHSDYISCLRVSLMFFELFY